MRVVKDLMYSVRFLVSSHNSVCVCVRARACRITECACVKVAGGGGWRGERKERLRVKSLTEHDLCVASILQKLDSAEDQHSILCMSVFWK